MGRYHGGDRNDDEVLDEIHGVVRSRNAHGVVVN